jgi:hypothetical protein
MAKRISREQKEIEAYKTIIDEMFKIAGHDETFDDIKNRTDDWYNQWTMTEYQFMEWTTWGQDYIKKTFRCNKIIAKRKMSMMGLNYGLKLQIIDNTCHSFM